MTNKNSKGFFTLPEHIKGGVEHGKRKFLTFYFDEESEYDRAVTFFVVRLSIRMFLCLVHLSF